MNAITDPNRLLPAGIPVKKSKLGGVAYTIGTPPPADQFNVWSGWINGQLNQVRTFLSK